MSGSFSFIISLSVDYFISWWYSTVWIAILQMHRDLEPMYSRQYPEGLGVRVQMWEWTSSCPVWASLSIYVCLFCVAVEASVILSGAARPGPIWHFPPRQTLRVELEPNTSISELLQHPSQACPPFIPLSCTGAHTHTHIHTHSWGVDGHALAVKRNRTDQLSSKECVRAHVHERVCNRCLIFVPFAPDNTTYDNPHVIGEREREMAALGISPDGLFVERFSYCAPHSSQSSEKTASTQKCVLSDSKNELSLSLRP